MSWVLKKVIDWFRSLFFKQHLEISVVGLQNAGKTTLINVLATNEFDKDTIPTIGFNLRHVRKGNINMKIWDLGGQAKFRESWEKYCLKSNVIIFVVDSADMSTIDTAKMELHQLMSIKSLEGKTLLVVGNKNDIEGALNEEDLIISLNLNDISNRTVACFSISAKNYNNIGTMLKWLTNIKK